MCHKTKPNSTIKYAKWKIGKWRYASLLSREGLTPQTCEKYAIILSMKQVMLYKLSSYWLNLEALKRFVVKKH